MKIAKLLIQSSITALACVGAIHHAQATLVAPYGWDGPGTGLQADLNSLVTPAPGDTWNRGTSNGSSPADYTGGTVQNGQAALDVLWALAGSGSSATIALEIAGHASDNTFGFYDPANKDKKAQLFQGSDSSGSKIYIRFTGNQLQSSSDNIYFQNVNGGDFSSATFGLYLQYQTSTYYSDPSLNANGGDNLVAYQGFGNTTTGRKIKINGSDLQAWDANSYVLGWEDLPVYNSDNDYNDMVMLVSQVTPVPEPTTLVAGGLMLLPLGASTIGFIRRRKMAA